MSATTAITILLAGCCLAFPAAAQTQKFATLVKFSSPRGTVPMGLMAYKNIFYGSTYFGGSANDGVVFALAPKTGGEHVLHDFTGGTDGMHPEQPPVSLAGVLYGTTTSGGGSRTCTGGCGTVYAVNPATHAYTVVHAFTGGLDGVNPVASLTPVGSHLFGTTSQGGEGTCSSGCGTIFKIDPASGKETILYRFMNPAAGQDPAAALLSHNNILYGTTYLGGTAGKGTVFSFDPATGIETTLHSFTDGADGAGPFAALVLQDGLLYGTTTSGGGGCRNDSCGTIYAIDPTTGNESIIFSFAGKGQGAAPRDLIFGGGTLLGSLYAGGRDYGLIYSFSLSSRTETVLHKFFGNKDGANPAGPMIYQNGMLYGTTSQGAQSNAGTAFELTP